MKISVVIPCRNEYLFIKECVEAIFGNIFTNEIFLNVFVVDGMSDDGTREIVINLKKKYTNLYLLDNFKQLTPFAFNIGIYEKPADFIQIVGSRHILSSNYMQEALNILQSKSDVWCVGGKLINEFTNKKGEIIALAMSSAFGMGAGNFRTHEKSCYTDTLTSPMYPSWVFDKIGYFDEELIRNQDDDFNFRISKAGGKIWLESKISLKYYIRSNFKDLYNQFYQYGYWKVFVNKKHKSLTTYRQLVPSGFVLFLFFVPIFLILGGFLFWSSIFLLMIYISFAIYLTFYKTKDIFYVILGLKTFLIIHIGYGFGYLYGILNFIILRGKPSDKQKQMTR